VTIEGATQTVTANVSVGVLDGMLRLREPRAARVVVTIERAGERLFASLRVTVRNAGAGRVSVDPAVVSVLIRGAGTMLGRVDARTVAPYVDVAGLGRGVHEVPVLLDLPSTLIGASVRPTTVRVTIN
jgi:YbbR domain-containing protein